MLILSTGVSHADDLLNFFPLEMVFGKRDLEKEKEIIETLTTLWVNFAGTG